MKNDILISIIVPVYNVEKYLDDCVKSLVKQTYQNIEIILVDDGSKDKSGKHCDKWLKKDNRIKVYHKENGGLSDARNYGLKKCNGEYVTFIDSDDDVTPDYVEYLYNLCLNYKTDISICSYNNVIDNKIIDNGVDYKEEKLSCKECLKRLLCEQGFTVSACAKLFKTKLFYDVEFPFGKLCEDNGTTYKLILKCKNIAYGNESKYNYYKRENSIMTSPFNERKYDLLEMTDLMCNDINKKYPDLKDYTEKRTINSHFSILRQMIFSKLNKENKKKEKEIIKYLKSKRKVILKNNIYDKRDRFAITSLLVGKWFFKLSWRIYLITK